MLARSGLNRSGLQLLDSDSDSDSDGSPLLAREQQQDLAPRLAFSHQQPQQRRSAGNAEHSKRDAFAFVESSLLRLTPSYASSAVSTPQPGVVTGENKRQSLDRESPDSMIDPSLSTLQTPCFARLSVGSSTAASQEQLVPSTSTASPISETDSLPSPSEQPSGRVAAGISIHRPANHSSPGCVSDSEDETQSFDLCVHLLSLFCNIRDSFYTTWQSISDRFPRQSPRRQRLRPQRCRSRSSSWHASHSYLLVWCLSCTTSAHSPSRCTHLTRCFTVLFSEFFHACYSTCDCPMLHFVQSLQEGHSDGHVR